VFADVTLDLARDARIGGSRCPDSEQLLCGPGAGLGRELRSLDKSDDAGGN
jgi:hypothetical protein